MADKKGFHIAVPAKSPFTYPKPSAHFRALIDTGRPIIPAAVLAFLTVLATFRHPEFLPAITVLFAVLAGVCLIFRRTRRFLFVLVILIWIAVNCLMTVRNIRQLQMLDNQEVTTTFTVTEAPVLSEAGQRMTVRISDRRFIGGFKATLFCQNSDYTVGRRYKARVQFSSVENTAYRRTNYGDSVYLSGFLLSQGDPVGKDPLLTTAGKIRSYVCRTLSERFSESESTTLSAITVGDRSDFSDDFSRMVRNAGVSHVMVVSGMHLAVILGTLSALIKKITQSRSAQAAAMGFGVFFFMAVCGFTMSIIRAGLTFLIAAAAPLFRRDYDPLTALSATVLIVISVSPFAALNLAFQLSVASTFGILVVTPFFLRLTLARIPKTARPISEAFFFPVYGSLAAMLMTLPVIVSAFGSVSLIAPLTNILINWAVSIALTLIVSALFLSVFPFIRLLSIPLFFVCGLLTEYINAVIRRCAQAATVIELPKSALFFTFLPILAVLCMITACNQRNYLLKLKKSQNERGALYGHPTRRRNQTGSAQSYSG